MINKYVYVHVYCLYIQYEFTINLNMSVYHLLPDKKTVVSTDVYSIFHMTIPACRPNCLVEDFAYNATLVLVNVL